MTMLSNLDLIRRVPLFSLLTVEQAQGIADSVVKRRFRRGELVVEHGRKSNALYILLTGRARAEDQEPGVLGGRGGLHVVRGIGVSGVESGRQAFPPPPPQDGRRGADSQGWKRQSDVALFRVASRPAVVTITRFSPGPHGPAAADLKESDR